MLFYLLFQNELNENINLLNKRLSEAKGQPVEKTVDIDPEKFVTWPGLEEALLGVKKQLEDLKNLKPAVLVETASMTEV